MDWTPLCGIEKTLQDATWASIGAEREMVSVGLTGIVVREKHERTIAQSSTGDGARRLPTDPFTPHCPGG